MGTIYLFIAHFMGMEIDVRRDWYRCGGHILEMDFILYVYMDWINYGFVSFENCRQIENGGDCCFWIFMVDGWGEW